MKLRFLEIGWCSTSSLPVRVTDLFYIRAVVKTDTPDRWRWLKRDYEAYQGPNVKNSKHIRSLYDTINKYRKESDFENAAAFEAAASDEPFCLVLEWLDVPLSELNPAKYKHNLAFMAALFRAQLGGVKDIAADGMVYTGTL